jgi:competence protein ComEA
MKSFFKAFATFNKAERMGIAVLLLVLLSLVVVRTTMHFFVKPAHNIEAEKKMLAEWEQFKAAQDAKGNEDTPIDSNNNRRPLNHKSSIAYHQSSLFVFDPNTVDSATLIKLGLRPRTVSIFLHWRAKGKKFYKKEEFRKVYTLTEEEYQRLEPYIIINK